MAGILEALEAVGIGVAIAALLYVIGAIAMAVLTLMALWGIHKTGQAQERMAGVMKQNQQLLQYQTDYAERTAVAAEAHAEAAKALAARLDRPQEVVLLQGAD